MPKPDFGKYFEKKQQVIKEVSDKKDKSIEFANALNNAVTVWSVLKQHPEIDPTGTPEEIMDWVKFFLAMKEDIRVLPPLPEVAPETVIENVQKTFEGSTVVQPPPPPPPPPDNFLPYTEAQRRKIFIEFGRAGYKEKSAQYAVAEMILGVAKITSFEAMNSGRGLSKNQASRLIEELIKRVQK